MIDAKPIACSLSAHALHQRLEEIASIGASSLISREGKAGAHELRFRSSDGNRLRLEKIISAERKCCPFLDLSLESCEDELVLAIAAPADGQAIADELAAAFASPPPIRH